MVLNGNYEEIFAFVQVMGSAAVLILRSAQKDRHAGIVGFLRTFGFAAAVNHNIAASWALL